MASSLVKPFKQKRRRDDHAAGGDLTASNRVAKEQSHPTVLSFWRHFLFSCFCLHGLPQCGHLFEELLEFDAGKAFDDWRDLRHDFGDVARQFAGAASDTVAGI